MERERERFILGLIHMIMEARKSHPLPFASWRTMKAGGVVQSKSKGPVIGEPMAEVQVRSEGLRTRNADIQRQRKWMSQLRQKEQIPPPLPFCSIHALSGLENAPPPHPPLVRVE